MDNEVTRRARASLKVQLDIITWEEWCAKNLLSSKAANHLVPTIAPRPVSSIFILVQIEGSARVIRRRGREKEEEEEEKMEYRVYTSKYGGNFRAAISALHRLK